MAELQWVTVGTINRGVGPQLSSFVSTKNERDQAQGQWIMDQKRGIRKNGKSRNALGTK
jgi:hypothetical protein